MRIADEVNIAAPQKLRSRQDGPRAAQRRESFRFLFDSNPVPVWVFDRETLRFLAVNDAAVEHYGYSRSLHTLTPGPEIRGPLQ